MLYTNYTRVNEKERDLNKQIDFCILFEILIEEIQLIYTRIYIINNNIKLILLECLDYVW